MTVTHTRHVNEYLCCCVELIRKASRRRLNNRTWWRAVKRNQTKQKKAKTHALNHAYCLGALRTHQMEKICIYKYMEQKIDKQQQQQCERDGNMCVVCARERDDWVYKAESTRYSCKNKKTMLKHYYFTNIMGFYELTKAIELGSSCCVNGNRNDKHHVKSPFWLMSDAYGLVWIGLDCLKQHFFAFSSSSMSSKVTKLAGFLGYEYFCALNAVNVHFFGSLLPLFFLCHQNLSHHSL